MIGWQNHSAALYAVYRMSLQTNKLH